MVDSEILEIPSFRFAGPVLFLLSYEPMKKWCRRRVTLPLVLVGEGFTGLPVSLTVYDGITKLSMNNDD